MTTKLEILGPYTPEHEGPYVWVKGNPVRCVVHAVVGDSAFITAEGKARPFLTGVSYIRNAKEIPVAREFWLIGGNTYTTKEEAVRRQEELLVRYSSKMCIIHVREVLTGDDQ